MCIFANPMTFTRLQAHLYAQRLLHLLNSSFADLPSCLSPTNQADQPSVSLSLSLWKSPPVLLPAAGPGIPAPLGFSCHRRHPWSLHPVSYRKTDADNLTSGLLRGGFSTRSNQSPLLHWAPPSLSCGRASDKPTLTVRPPIGFLPTYPWLQWAYLRFPPPPPPPRVHTLT